MAWRCETLMCRDHGRCAEPAFPADCIEPRDPPAPGVVWMTVTSRPLRLAEAAAVLSLATDLAMGQSLEHGLRTALLALRTAQAMGLPEDDQVAVFYTGVLHFAGCTAESSVDAGFFGDELVARPQMMAAYLGPRLALISTAMRVVHPGSAPLMRAAAMARSAVGGVAEFRKWAASHCDVARLLGARGPPSPGGPHATTAYPPRSRPGIRAMSGYSSEPEPEPTATPSSELWTGQLPARCPAQHAVDHYINGEAKPFVGVSSDQLGGVGSNQRKVVGR